MTGFGKAVVEVENKRITFEIKSLNSKQLDMIVRIPAAYREKELEIRNRVGRSLERGKVEVNVHTETLGNEIPAQFNTPILASYKEKSPSCQKLSLFLSPLTGIRFSSACRMCSKPIRRKLPTTARTMRSYAPATRQPKPLWLTAAARARDLRCSLPRESNASESF